MDTSSIMTAAPSVPCGAKIRLAGTNPAPLRVEWADGAIEGLAPTLPVEIIEV